jgi:hypothetical protein
MNHNADAIMYLRVTSTLHTPIPTGENGTQSTDVNKYLLNNTSHHNGCNLHHHHRQFKLVRFHHPRRTQAQAARGRARHHQLRVESVTARVASITVPLTFRHHHTQARRPLLPIIITAPNHRRVSLFGHQPR